MSQRTTYILIAFICLIPVIVLGTTGIPVLTNVEPDGDVTLADGKHVATDEVRARDSGGLKLYDDGGADGLLIREDGFGYFNLGASFHEDAEMFWNLYLDGSTHKFLDDGYAAGIKLENGSLKIGGSVTGENISGAGATCFYGNSFEIDLGAGHAEFGGMLTAAGFATNGLYVKTDHLRALDSSGLELFEDSGTMGIRISDSGAVTVTELATGLVKSTAGVLSGAAAGTDYFSPSANATLDDTYYFASDGVRARDSGGLDLSDDSGNAAIQIPDGGGVDIWMKPYPADGTSNGLKGDLVIDSGVTTAFGVCLHLDTDGEFIKSDADASATMPCHAIAVEAGTGGYKKAILKGFLRNSGWSFTPGETLYASTTEGELTATAPSGSGDVVQIVGFAVSGDRIFFDPNLATNTIP